MFRREITTVEAYLLAFKSNEHDGADEYAGQDFGLIDDLIERIFANA